MAAPAETFFFAGAGPEAAGGGPTRSALLALGVDGRIRAILQVWPKWRRRFPARSAGDGPGAADQLRACGIASVNGAMAASKVSPDGVVIV